MINVKFLILLITLIISTILSLYIYSEESKKEKSLNLDSNIKVLNRGEDRITLKPGYEKIGTLQARKVDSWSRETPSSSMRVAQYKLDYVKGDGQLVVFSGIGGSPDENIERWYKQFKPESNLPIAETSLKWEIVMDQFKIKFVHFEGTFIKSDIRMNSVTEELKDYALLAAIISGAKEPYYFKMTGPSYLIKSEKSLFESFIKSIQEL
tara:strand:+ start:51 stop:677 length:627 start_codon:yes stop_codon:yes gene_type:complete